MYVWIFKFMWSGRLILKPHMIYLFDVQDEIVLDMSTYQAYW